MKKFYLLGAIGLMMASCANDDLVVKPEAPTVDAQAAIAFKGRLGNMSRATTSQLETVMDNFGVWAIKANSDADVVGINLTTSALVVMPNYKVINTGTTLNYGSDWTYVMDNPKQYLKYWDGSYNKTYFFAYGPYSSTGVSLAIANDGTNDVATLTFPEYEMGTTAADAYIYANPQVETNADHITASAANTTVAPKTVPLHFNRLFSQLQIAFYEEIPGYKVEMLGVEFTDGENGGVAAIPAVNDKTATNAADLWARGPIAAKGTPSVAFSDDGYQTAAVSYTNAATYGEAAKENLWFGLPTTNLTTVNGVGFVADKNADAWDDTKTPKAQASYSETVYNVLPCAGGTNPVKITNAAGTSLAGQNAGLQFVVRYKLYSVDTNEAITVNNARVYVPADYTQWAPNTLYTYIFRITTNSSGTTTDTNPVDDPVEPTPCLYPIIFDDVTIEDLNKQEYEFDITGLVMSQLTAEVAAGADLTLTLTALDANGVAVPVTDATWASSNAEVATVANGVVHGVAPDTAIITAEYEVRDNRTLVASCVVIVKEATPAPSPKPAR